jgi:hypothetical protein
MEAIWTRFTPLIQILHKILHEEKVDITSLPSESRHKDPALGVGSFARFWDLLLDLGLVSLDQALIGDAKYVGSANVIRWSRGEY